MEYDHWRRRRFETFNKSESDRIWNLDDLLIKITNGRKTVINKKVGIFKGDIEYIIKDTGCEKVSVNISRDKQTLYNDTIPFHCGE